MKRVLIFILFLQVSTFTFAGAWLEQKGSGYFNTSFTYLVYNGIFGSDGSRLELPWTIRDYTINAYLEYGATEQTTLLASIPYKMTGVQFTDTSLSPIRSFNHFSNSFFGLKRAFYTSSYVLSGQVKYFTNVYGAYD